MWGVPGGQGLTLRSAVILSLLAAELQAGLPQLWQCQPAPPSELGSGLPGLPHEPADGASAHKLPSCMVMPAMASAIADDDWSSQLGTQLSAYIQLLDGFMLMREA